MTQIRNYTKDCFDYFTNGGSGVESGVDLWEKKSLREIEQQKRERDWEDRDLEKRESYKEREREHERREERELTEERAYWWETERCANDCLECFRENLGVKQLDIK